MFSDGCGGFSPRSSKHLLLVMSSSLCGLLHKSLFPHHWWNGDEMLSKIIFVDTVVVVMVIASDLRPHSSDSQLWFCTRSLVQSASYFTVLSSGIWTLILTHMDNLSVFLQRKKDASLSFSPHFFPLSEHMHVCGLLSPSHSGQLRWLPIPQPHTLMHTVRP